MVAENIALIVCRMESSLFYTLSTTSASCHISRDNDEATFHLIGLVLLLNCLLYGYLELRTIHVANLCVVSLLRHNECLLEFIQNGQYGVRINYS